MFKNKNITSRSAIIQGLMIAVGFCLILATAFTFILFNKNNLKNYITTQDSIIKEQHYYNERIAIAAQDAGLSKKQVDYLLIDERQTKELSLTTIDNLFEAKAVLLNSSALYQASLKSLQAKKLSLTTKQKEALNDKLEVFQINLYRHNKATNRLNHLTMFLQISRFWKKAIYIVDLILIIFLLLLFVSFARQTNSIHILFFVSNFNFINTILTLFLAIFLTLYSTFFLEQRLSGETLAFFYVITKSIRQYLWFTIFILYIIGFLASIIATKMQKDDQK